MKASIAADLAKKEAQGNLEIFKSVSKLLKRFSPRLLLNCRNIRIHLSMKKTYIKCTRMCKILW